MYSTIGKNLLHNKTIYFEILKKTFSCKKGIVIGVFKGSQDEPKLTTAGCLLDEQLEGKISTFLKNKPLEKSEVYLMTNVSSCSYNAVALAGAGCENVGYNKFESLDQKKENIRIAAAIGTRSLMDFKIDNIVMEGLSDPEAAAEGAWLSMYKYQDIQTTRETLKPTICPEESVDKSCWNMGEKKAQAQNIARELEDAPPNLMTPQIFSEKAMDYLCPLGVNIDVREYEWIESNKFNNLWAVGKSSATPPIFVELNYCGGSPSDAPVVITGKGVTFDSGGLSLKKCRELPKMKADMAGAAVAIGVFNAAAKLNIPLNLKAFLPLCENMPSASSLRPGDVLLSLNGKTIEARDPSHEGRLILADTLAYSSKVSPCLLINVATLTNGIKTALGSSSTGLFTNSDYVWSEMCKSGAETGDRVWRMPLWEFFRERVTGIEKVDVSNVSKGSGADPCTGAAFLKEFAPPGDFVHLDITGTGMISSGHSYPYLREGGSTGRPVRTIVQFLMSYSSPIPQPSSL